MSDGMVHAMQSISANQKTHRRIFQASLPHLEPGGSFFKKQAQIYCALSERNGRQYEKTG